MAIKKACWYYMVDEIQNCRISTSELHFFSNKETIDAINQTIFFLEQQRR